MDPRDLSPDVVRALFTPEMRTVTVPLADLEWRTSGSQDGTRILNGYAAVYEQETTLYDGMYYTLKERIQRGAFGPVLAGRPDVHLNIGHDMTRAIARTGIVGAGQLDLTTDDHGLKVYARMDSEDPDVIALGHKMDLGIMDQMSFAFRVLMSGCKYESETDSMGHETEVRTITEIAELYDVCVCAQGAYSQTEAALRSLMGNGAALPVPPSGEGAHVANREVEPDTQGAAVPSVERQRAQAKARAAAYTYRERTLQ